MKSWNLLNSKERIISDINITPLTDVMLVLLVIFMVTTPLLVMESFKIKLPRAVSSGTEEGKGLAVTITKDSSIYVNSKKVEPEALFQVIKKMISQDAERNVIIKADKDVRHGEVVRVLDSAKRAGAKRISIATEPGSM